MAYPSLPGKPTVGAQWTSAGDAIHDATAEAIADVAAASTALTQVKGTANTLGATLAPTNSPGFTGTVSGVTKGMVGLGNVDNTSDAAKTYSGGQFNRGTLPTGRLPAGMFAVRRRTSANEAAPTATNWEPRPFGFGTVLAVGAPPDPADATALDLRVPLASTPVVAAAPIALNDGSSIPVLAGSTAYTGLIGSVATTTSNTTVRDSYLSAFAADRLLPGYRQAGANICALLYSDPSQVPATYPTLTLDFTSTNVIAQTWRSQSRIEFGTQSIGASVTASYTTHEIAHLFMVNAPLYGTNATVTGVVEGIADWCLIQLGYHTEANQRPAGGGSAWDAGYDTSAFFFDYVEKVAGGGTPGFVRQLNSSLNSSSWSSSVITGMNVQGKTVTQLWADYKAMLAPPTVYFTDQENVTFTGASQTSRYHAYGAGRTTGAGLLVWLHGDGAYEFNNPSSTYVMGGTSGVRKACADNNYILVSALAPDTTGAVTWWENGATKAAYVKALLDYLKTKYQPAAGRVVLAGFSGGAQQTTQFFLASNPDYFSAGGGTIAIGGGEAPDNNPTFSAATKANMWMHWAAGANDTAANSSDGFDGRATAEYGEQWFRGKGIARTSIQIIPGEPHDITPNFGPVVAAQLAAHPSAS